jgi:hypothetical protein
LKLRFSVDVDKSLLKSLTKRVENRAEKAVQVVAQDLARTASETAPHFTGDLEDSYFIAYHDSGNKFYADIEFAVYHGSFNYAIAMHEWTYNLGIYSEIKDGGTGMSGANYPVGRKYLTRVLEGEAQTYADYISDKIKRALEGRR